MAAVSSIVVLLILAISAGLLHVPIVRDFALEKSRQYLVDSQNIDLEADKLDYNLFRLSSTLHGVRVRSTEDPDEPPFFVADKVYLNLGISSLWRGKLEVQEGSIEGGRIEIVYDAEGRSNLPKPVERPDAGEPVDTNETLPFLLRNFKASGPIIRFADQAAEFELTLPAWTLAIDGDRATENHRIQFGIDSQGDLDYQDRSLPLRTVSADLGFRPGGLGVSKVLIQAGESRIELTGEVSDMNDAQLDLRASIQAAGGELAAFAGLEKPVSGQFDLDVDIGNRADAPDISAEITGANVLYGEFQGGELETVASYAAGAGRASIESLRFSGPFGEVLGSADLALTEEAGLSRTDIALSGFNLLTAAREFGAPMLPAAHATGSVEMSWTGMELTDAAGSGELRLTATRQSPAENVLPVSGGLSFQTADGRIETILEDLATLGVSIDGSVSISEQDRLRGTLQVEAPDLQPTIAQLDAFLGNAGGESISPTPVSGPLSARLDLDGTLDSPGGAIRASSANLTAGEVEGVAFDLEGGYRGDTLELGSLSLGWNGQQVAVQGGVTLAGESPALNLTVQAEEIALADALALLNRQEPVTGIASLEAQVRGTAAEPEISSTLAARELTAYGETWGALSANLSMAGSLLSVTDLELTKPQSEGDGVLRGSAAFDTGSQEYTLDIESDGIRLTELKLPSGEAVSGSFDVRAQGTGTVEDPAIDAALTATDLVVDGEEYGSLDVQVAVQNGLARLGAKAPKFKLDVRAESRLEAPYPASFQAAIDGLDLSTLGVEAREGEPLTGAVTGVIEGSGEIDNWQDGTVTANFEQAELAAAGVSIRNDGPWRLGVRDRRLMLESFSVLSGRSAFSLEGELPFEEAQPEGELRVDGAFNLEVVPTMMAKSPEEAFVLGILTMSGAVRGSFEKVEPDVDLKLEDAVVFTPETLYPVVNIQMDAHVDSRRVELRSLTADYSKGKLTVEGGVPFGVLVSGQDLPLEVSPDGGEAQFNAAMTGLKLDELDIIPDGGGLVSFELEASAPRLELEAVTARLIVPELELQVRDLQLGQAQPIALAVEDGALRIESFHLTGPRTELRATGKTALDGEGPLDMQLDGEADAGIVGYLVEDIRMSGPAQLQAAVTGTLEEPVVDGTFTLRQGTFSYPAPRLDSESFELAVRFDHERVEIERLEGRAQRRAAASLGRAELHGWARRHRLEDRRPGGVPRLPGRLPHPLQHRPAAPQRGG